MNEISETQSNLDELMNEYEVAVIGENRGRNRSGYSEKADKYYQKRRELKEFVGKIEGEVTRLLTESDDAHMAEARYIAKAELAKRDARIAELEEEVTKGNELQDSYCDRIAKLEAYVAELEAEKRGEK